MNIISQLNISNAGSPDWSLLIWKGCFESVNSLYILKTKHAEFYLIHFYYIAFIVTLRPKMLYSTKYIKWLCIFINTFTKAAYTRIDW